MTESNMGKSVIRIWIEFEALRKDLEKKVHECELSNFSLTYGAKSEQDFRQKLGDARVLLDKIDALVGPPKTEPSVS